MGIGWVKLYGSRHPLGSDGKVVRWCAAKHEGEAARRIGGHRLLQVEGFERNVAADAVGANVFEVTIR